VEALLRSPREDITVYENMDPDEAMRVIQAKGGELNQGNPWVIEGPTLRRDKLRSRLGFWKAIGCDATILSWIAYGKKLSFHSEPEQLSFRNHYSVKVHKSFATETCEKAILDGSFRQVGYSFAHIINPL
jgi:hypothetical protein